MVRMAHRFVAPDVVAALLQQSRHPLAQRAAKAVTALPPSELLPVNAGPPDLATYEVRLARSMAGEGPSTLGLAEFVEALRVPDPGLETLSFTDGETFFIVVLDGEDVAAITGVESS